MSMIAKIIFFLVRKSGIKRRLVAPGNADKILAHERKRGPAKPTGWLRRNCQIDQQMIDGHIVYELTPRKKNKTKPPTLHIFYLHGGAYIFSIVSLHWRFIGKLLRRTGASATVPLYPLSPEHKWDESYAMVIKAYDQAAAKYGAENIVIMGDSAGGGFSLGLAQMLRNRGKQLPQKLILLSPYLDQTAADPAQLELEKSDVLISIEGVRMAGRWWVNEGENPAMFPVSPLFEPVEGLPPMLVFAGSVEMLLSDARRLKQKADLAGTMVDLHVYPGMQHVWMLLPIAEARQVLNEIVAFVKS